MTKKRLEVSDTVKYITEYTYNTDGIRVESYYYETVNDGPTQNEATTKFHIDPYNHTGYAQVIEEKDGLGTITKSYTIGDDILTQAIDSGAGWHLLYDGHGSTRQLVSGSVGSTNIVDDFSYDAYGVLLQDESVASANPGKTPTQATGLLYAGEQFDVDAQQYYLRARYYNQNNGRFNRMDPFAGSSSDPQSLHKYLYVHCNPINSIDPSGLMEFSTVGMMQVAFISGLITANIAGWSVALKGGTVDQIVDAQWNWFWKGAALGAIVYGGIWAVHSLWLLIFGGGGTAVTLNNGTDLYRVVDKAELNIIRSTNSFQFRPTDARPAGEAAGKFFWGSYQEALAWQQNLAKFGETDLTIVKTTIDSTVPVWRYGGIADGIGNSYFVAMEYLTGTIQMVNINGGP